MKENDFVRLIRDRDEYDKIDMGIGMGGVIMGPRPCEGYWNIFVQDPEIYPDTKAIALREEDLKVCDMPIYVSAEVGRKVQEYDRVRLIVEKEEYANDGVHKGMTGWICDPRKIVGKWLVSFDQYGALPEIACLSVKEEDFEIVTVEYIKC